MGRRLFFLLIVFTLLIAAGSGAAWVWFNDQLEREGPNPADEVVLIPPGSGINKIANLLVKRGVLRSVLLFRLAARLEKTDRELRPGELKFPSRGTIKEVLGVLRRGESVARTVTIPEGLTVVEAFEIIDNAEGLQGRMPPLPLEGALLPETYQYHYYDKKSAIVQRMEKAMNAALNAAWAARAEGLPLTSSDEALTLASIIEKETGVAKERPRVAGVFINRLNRGMKLQSDPTVIYGITLGKQPLGRELTRKDLKSPTPYNTYTIKALPPGPIANPGLASIQAALNPAKTDDLYFVADGTGGHAFAKTLKEHNRNVRRWRKLRKN